MNHPEWMTYLLYPANINENDIIIYRIHRTSEQSEHMIHNDDNSSINTIHVRLKALRCYDSGTFQPRIPCGMSYTARLEYCVSCAVSLTIISNRYIYLVRRFTVYIIIYIYRHCIAFTYTVCSREITFFFF